MAIGSAAIWIADRTDAPAKYVVLALGLACLFRSDRAKEGALKGQKIAAGSSG
jgi:hypothetical protein